MVEGRDEGMRSAHGGGYKKTEWCWVVGGFLPLCLFLVLNDDLEQVFLRVGFYLHQIG